MRLHTAEVAEQRDMLGTCRRLCAGDGHGKRGVCAEDGFVFRAVQRDERGVDGGEVIRVHAAERFVNSTGDIFACLQNALSAVELHVVVAQFMRFKLSGGCAAGRDACADRAAGKPHLRFDGRVSAGIQHLPPDDADDFGFAHRNASVLPFCRRFCRMGKRYAGGITKRLLQG